MAPSKPVRWVSAVLLLLASSCARQERTQSCKSKGGSLCELPSGVVCVDLSKDRQNCGRCGEKCGAQLVCHAGHCVDKNDVNATLSCTTGLLECDHTCVDVKTHPSHCGACGAVCSDGKTCKDGQCVCSASTTDCGSGQCVNLATNAEHCGSCERTCGASAPLCNAGNCALSCGVGHTKCLTSCVNVLSDADNCGSCGVECSPDERCQGGLCRKPSEGAGGAPSASGTGGSAAGSTGLEQGGATAVASSPIGGATGAIGGASGISGSTGSGGSSGAPGNLCPSGLVIATEDMISDFNTENRDPAIANVADPFLVSPKNGQRGATAWYSYYDDTKVGASTVELYASSRPLLVHNTTHGNGTCSPRGALEVTSSGNLGYGTGFGVAFLPELDPAAHARASYDASAYTGVSFFMRCTGDVDQVDAKVIDANNDATQAVPRCSKTVSSSALRLCNPYGLKNVTVTKDWSQYRIYFDEMLPDPTLSDAGAPFESRAITALEIQVNTKAYRNRKTRAANGYTCYVDDVHFLRDEPPSRSNTATVPRTCNANAQLSAPGGYYTTPGSNRIWDCKNGLPHIFKGIARPSLEWDPAGRNMTYADLRRIADWNANVVRLSVSQAFWLDPSMGKHYQAYVDRSVKWSLALGMDVIIDLHPSTSAIAGTPDADSLSFWSEVAASYQNEGRVSFELYSEASLGGEAPTDDDWEAWQRAMQSLVDVVRARAKNLVLVGGLNWSYDLSGVASHLIRGDNVAYVAHPFDVRAIYARDWDSAFGDFAQTYPVVATEFGQVGQSSASAAEPQKVCEAAFYSELLDYFADAKRSMGWTAWAWFVDTYETVPEATHTCGFPQLITSYDGTANAVGEAVKQALR